MNGRKSFHKWAIILTGSPLSDQMQNYHSEGQGGAPCFYRTRSGARAAAAKMRADKPWAFTGPWACVSNGTRVYQDAKVVKVKVSVEPAP